MGEKQPSSQDVRRTIGQLWPVAKGSLNQVRKPCVRPNCRACASGERHPAWLFTFRQGGRQRCMYVPQELVPILQQAIENGRELEQLMVASGAALIREHRRKRGGAPS